MIVFKKFTFDSAHFLPNVPEGHNCKEIHGHTYNLAVYIEGGLEKDYDWVIDFADIKKVITPVIKTIDHKLLNDIDGLETIFEKKKITINKLTKVTFAR